MAAPKGKILYANGRYPFPAPAAVVPGDVVARPDGSFAVFDGLQGFASGVLIEADPIVPCKVVEFIAATGDTWSAGASIYWDATNKITTTTSSGNTLLGKSIYAKTSGQLTTQIVVS